MPEFLFTTADFQRVRDLIHQQAGISLGESKREMVYSRLTRLVRARRLTSFAEYLELLEQGRAEEWEAFTNALTTNLTAFFREPHHFPILTDLLRKTAGKRSIRLWSCAASTGEEPYSMAMTVVETLGRFDAPVRILATDIDTAVLEKAQRGVYPLERVERLEKDRLKRFFLQGVNKNAGLARVRPELRKLISFQPLNLLEERWPLREPFDAIFCRNVMIYFDKPTQYRILEKFAPLLRPDGLLFAGHSESFTHAGGMFRCLGQTVYQLRQANSGKLAS